MSEGILAAHERIEAKRHKGQVTWISPDRKEMKLTIAVPESKVPVSETVGETQSIRISYEIRIKDQVRLKIKDFWSAAWEKDDGTTTAAAETTKKNRKKRKFLDTEVLTGEKGFGALINRFPRIKFKGPTYETPDLHKLILAYRDWIYNIEPKYNFHRVVRRIELLGGTKALKSRLLEMRMKQNIGEEDEDDWPETDDPDFDAKIEARDRRRKALVYQKSSKQESPGGELQVDTGNVAATTHAKTAEFEGEAELAFEESLGAEFDEDAFAVEQEMGFDFEDEDD